MDDVALLHALFDGIEAGDFDRVAGLFTADAVFWHNVDNREKPLTESIATLRAARTLISSCRYEERRYLAVANGAVGQHVGRTRTKDGIAVEIPTMLRFYFDGGRIRRVEEYFDSSQAMPLMGKLASFRADQTAGGPSPRRDT